MTSTIYDSGLDRNPANHQPLTPLTLLERAAAVFPERLAIVHGPLRRNYREFHTRCRRLASALAARGIGRGDTVAIIAANTPAMLECHYGAPMTGGVLNTLNTRLDAAAIAFMLEHGEAKIFIVDREFSALAAAALKLIKTKPLVVDYDDPEYSGPGERIGAIEYEDFVASGDETYQRAAPHDEWDAIALNYTSGTTGDPKGVVYHHRGANLLAVGNVVTADMGRHPVYLWTLPMFHCNGWCFPWSISVKAGTHVCLRQVRAKLMALPAPVNEYSIALPQEMKKQIEEDLRRADAAAWEYVEDAGDAETRQERERERERQRQLERRSAVLKRDLPRPKAVNLHSSPLKHHSSASLARAEELVQGTPKRLNEPPFHPSLIHSLSLTHTNLPQPRPSVC